MITHAKCNGHTQKNVVDKNDPELKAELVLYLTWGTLGNFIYLLTMQTT